MKPQGRVAPYGVFGIVLEVVYVGFNGDMRIYTGLFKEMCVHLEMCFGSRSYIRVDFVKFFCSCISLSGPLCLLWEPCFYHNKII
jgi:hypothetical protein